MDIMKGKESKKQPDLGIPAKCNAKEEGGLNNITAKVSEEESVQCNGAGFERGLDPECIVGVTKNSNDELVYLMKWKGSSIKDFVPSHIANIKCPQLVISYYESIIKWKTLSTDEEEKRKKAHS